MGYQVAPGSIDKKEKGCFSWVTLKAYVGQWEKVQLQPQVMVIDGSPWTYLAKFAHGLPSGERAMAHQLLSSLMLPDLVILLVTSGREVQRRSSPDAQGDKVARLALVQIRELQLLPGSPCTVDAT